MTLDIRKPEFWKLDAVDQEQRRVYDICSGCRRCLPLCPSFKVLFDRLDTDAVDGDVEKLPARDVKEVVDLCYQCKLSTARTRRPIAGRSIFRGSCCAPAPPRRSRRA